MESSDCFWMENPWKAAAAFGWKAVAALGWKIHGKQWLLLDGNPWKAAAALGIRVTHWFLIVLDTINKSGICFFFIFLPFPTTAGRKEIGMYPL